MPSRPPGRSTRKASAKTAGLSVGRVQTRSDHLRLVAEYLRWKPAPAGSEAMKELEQFLTDRAMEHDSPTLLFTLAQEYLISAKTIRPGVTILAKMVASARTAADALTFEKLEHPFTAELIAELDRLLVYDADLGMTRVAWLLRRAVEASANAVKTAIEKLLYLRGMDAHLLDLSVLAAERRRFLARVGRRSTNQALERPEPERRHPILLTLVAQSAVDLLDEVVALFDQAVCARSVARARRTRAVTRQRNHGWWARAATAGRLNDLTRWASAGVGERTGHVRGAQCDAGGAARFAA
ncbi:MULTISPECIES: DUF4158 domain-containing protein [Kribbella]|uniref:DUF4158 domain-containing protein n=1 Tax=Kribbella TaxID=182639 RepID=UPI001F543C2F|nr:MULTISPECIES: DUF4158 domain-containing protein [Kribbella]